METQTVDIQSWMASAFWFWIAFAEAVAIIIGMVYHKYANTERHRQKKKILAEENVDFDNVIDSSFRAKPLYDSLKRKCHPDLLQDNEKKRIATDIFAELVRCKYDYEALQKIQKRAVYELNVKI